jgi:hypothetical protein
MNGAPNFATILLFILRLLILFEADSKRHVSLCVGDKSINRAGQVLCNGVTCKVKFSKRESQEKKRLPRLKLFFFHSPLN